MPDLPTAFQLTERLYTEATHVHVRLLASQIAEQARDLNCNVDGHLGRTETLLKDHAAQRLIEAGVGSEHHAALDELLRAYLTALYADMVGRLPVGRITERGLGDYVVRWEIDVTAESPEAAARKALEIQRDPNSLATVFDVQEAGGVEPTRIDLHALDDQAVAEAYSRPVLGAPGFVLREAAE